MAERLELWCIPYTGIFKTASLHTDSVPDSFLWDFNPLTGPIEAVQPNIQIRESPYGFMNNLDLILILSESDSYLTSSLIYAVGESDFMKRKSFCAYEFFVYLIGKETSLT